MNFADGLIIGLVLGMSIMSIGWIYEELHRK